MNYLKKPQNPFSLFSWFTSANLSVDFQEHLLGDRRLQRRRQRDGHYLGVRRLLGVLAGEAGAAGGAKGAAGRSAGGCQRGVLQAGVKRILLQVPAESSQETALLPQLVDMPNSFTVSPRL